MRELVCWCSRCADEEEEQGAEVSSEKDEKQAGSLWMHGRRVSVWQIPLTALCQLSVARHDSSGVTVATLACLQDLQLGVMYEKEPCGYRGYDHNRLDHADVSKFKTTGYCSGICSFYLSPTWVIIAIMKYSSSYNQS